MLYREMGNILTGVIRRRGSQISAQSLMPLPLDGTMRNIIYPDKLFVIGRDGFPFVSPVFWIVDVENGSQVRRLLPVGRPRENLFTLRWERRRTISACEFPRAVHAKNRPCPRAGIWPFLSEVNTLICIARDRFT